MLTHCVVLYNGNVTYYANTCLVSFHFVPLFTHTRSLCLSVTIAFALFHIFARTHTHTLLHRNIQTYINARVLTFALILAFAFAFGRVLYFGMTFEPLTKELYSYTRRHTHTYKHTLARTQQMVLTLKKY